MENLKNDETFKNSLISKYGINNVFDTSELQENFKVIEFYAPYVIVERKSDNIKGNLKFTHKPRFYFDFLKE